MTTVTSMITSFDDFPIHQTWEPVAHPESGDPGHYDRYFFNGYTKDASVFFAVAMGLYPNRHVMDASFSVIVNGEQINLRASARAAEDRMACTAIGPIEIQIVEPLKKHRILIDSPEHGIRADILFTASSLPYEEPPFHVRSGNRVTMRYTRLTQLGHWSGWIEADGVTHTLKDDDVFGSRDRSWGIRGVGERVQLGAPAQQLPQFYWLWAPVCFDDFGTVFDVNEYADGQRWHESGAHLIGPDAIQHAHSVSYTCEWQPGTRHMKSFQLNYSFAQSEATLTFTPKIHFQMSGLGYLHPEWGHGMWKGELAIGFDRLTLPVQDPMAMHHIHVQTLSDVTCQFDNGQLHRGIGVLETLVLGMHQPSGFSGISDGR